MGRETQAPTRHVLRETCDDIGACGNADIQFGTLFCVASFRRGALPVYELKKEACGSPTDISF